jgi:hypothetical protein
MWNMKPYIYYDGGENILNGIIGCILFLTMGAIKKVIHEFL